MKDRIAEEKENKVFRKWDLVVYGVIILIIIGLFIGVFLTRDKNGVSSIEVQYDGVNIMTYNFDEDSLQYAPEYISVEKVSSSEYRFTFNLDGDYNILHVDLTARTVTCEDANCSFSKDCTTMKITKAGDTIICAPHKLVVIAKGNREDIKEPVIG